MTLETLKLLSTCTASLNISRLYPCVSLVEEKQFTCINQAGAVLLLTCWPQKDDCKYSGEAAARVEHARRQTLDAPWFTVNLLRNYMSCLTHADFVKVQKSSELKHKAVDKKPGPEFLYNCIMLKQLLKLVEEQKICYSYNNQDEISV